MDDLIDKAHESISLAVRAMACRLGIHAPSFATAAEDLYRVGQYRMSGEALRQLVESEGRIAAAAQNDTLFCLDDPQLKLDFDAGTWETKQTADNKPVTRAYLGLDGFLLPMVTCAEKRKRFEKAKARRKTLPRRRGIRRAKLVLHKGSDQAYKEFKLVAVYSQCMRHKLVRVTNKNADEAGKLLRGLAEDVHLPRAREIIPITDGAEWIARLIEQRVPPSEGQAVLDFYHAREHVQKARKAVYGETSEEGATWEKALAQRMLEEPFEKWFETIMTLRGGLRSRTKRRAVDALIGYLQPRREKLEYAAFKARGWMIGSGPTESACKSHARRLKGAGMRWNNGNAVNMLALESLDQSGLWDAYWANRLKRAA